MRSPGTPASRLVSRTARPSPESNDGAAWTLPLRVPRWAGNPRSISTKASAAPRQVLLRQPDDGRAADPRWHARRAKEARRARHHLLLSQVRPAALPRGEPVERLPGRDQRALRPGQEDAAGAVAGVSRAVRV